MMSRMGHLRQARAELEAAIEQIDAAIESLRSVEPLTDLDQLELTVRSRNCLRNMGIETVEQLLGTPPGNFMQQPNFGAISLRDLRHELDRFGLGLAW